MTAAKKASQAFHGIPVFSAILNMRFMVPRSRTRVESNESFIFSASAEESRISSPIATVNCAKSISRDPRSHHTPRGAPPNPQMLGGRQEAHILQHPHLARQRAHLLLVLTLQLVQHGIRILPLLVRRRRPKRAAHPTARAATARPRIRPEAAAAAAAVGPVGRRGPVERRRRLQPVATGRRRAAAARSAVRGLRRGARVVGAEERRARVALVEVRAESARGGKVSSRGFACVGGLGSRCRSGGSEMIVRRMLVTCGGLRTWRPLRMGRVYEDRNRRGIDGVEVRGKSRRNGWMKKMRWVFSEFRRYKERGSWITGWPLQSR